MDRLRRHELLHVTPTDGDDVFVLYEYQLTTGEVFRNTEVLTVRDGQIVEAQVFFGVGSMGEPHRAVMGGQLLRADLRATTVPGVENVALASS